MKKIKTAFIYKPSNPYMSKTAWATTYYHFFMNALNRHADLDMAYFPAEKKFDVSKLRDKFDIILLWENHPWGSPDELSGIQNLDIPVICRINDPQDTTKGKIDYHEKYKIDHYFGYLPERFFYKYYPKNFKYKMIFYGVEPKLYENLTPYSKRIKKKIYWTLFEKHNLYQAAAIHALTNTEKQYILKKNGEKNFWKGRFLGTSSRT